MAITLEDIQTAVEVVLSDYKKLSLSQRGIRDEDIILICNFLAQNTQIGSLDLSNNLITEIGAETLANNIKDNIKDNRNLDHINLNKNKIKDKGAAAFASNKTLNRLELSDNEIGDKGAAAFANSPSLRYLSLSHNDIGDEGAAALASNTTLRFLDLDNNKIGDAGIKALNNNLSFKDPRALHTKNQNSTSTQKSQPKQTPPNQFHQEYIDTINILMKKTNQFKNHPRFTKDPQLTRACNAAETLYKALKKEGSIYFNAQPTQQTFEAFKSGCETHIETARKELNKHRGWQKILLNIFAIIITAGIGYALAAGINIVINKGKLSFFSTDSSQKLDKIEQHIKNKWTPAG